MNYETILKNAIKKIMRRMVDEDKQTYFDSAGESLPTLLVEDVLDVLGIIEIEAEHSIWDWAFEVMEEFAQ